MTSIPPPMCVDCARRVETKGVWLACQAYPDGIPREIIEGEWDHRFPKPGDHGLQFVPREDAEPQEWGRTSPRAAPAAPPTSGPRDALRAGRRSSPARPGAGSGARLASARRARATRPFPATVLPPVRWPPRSRAAATGPGRS